MADRARLARYLGSTTPNQYLVLLSNGHTTLYRANDFVTIVDPNAKAAPSLVLAPQELAHTVSDPPGSPSSTAISAMKTFTTHNSGA